MEISFHAHNFEPVLNIVFSEDIFEIQPKIEPLNFTKTIGRPHFVKIDAVIAQRKMAIQKHGTPGRHNCECAATSNVSPTVIREIDPGAVIQHTRVVIEVESEQAELGAICATESDFPKRIREAKRQAPIIDVWIKQFGRLVEVTVLDA